MKDFIKALKKLPYKQNPGLGVAVACVFLGLILLGSWQVARLKWKNNLMTQVTRNMDLPSINIPSDPDLIQQMQFRRVKAKGKFLNNNEIHLAARYYKSKVGYNILTPFALDKGKVILVNRGWVPPEKKTMKNRKGTIINSPVTIEGIILKPYKKGWFTPAHDIKDNLWFWADIPSIEAETKLKLIPMILQQTGNDTKTFPVKIPAKVEIRNDHLQYALTWYSLALALVVMYLLFLREQKENNK